MKIDAERNGPQFAVKGDTRVTSIGWFLRKTRLDELPQLWNVLRGEMSFVGPRPERPEFIDNLTMEIPNYINRLGLKPGLTGLAQIINGYDNDIESFKRKVNLDLLYLQNCCLRNDIKIMIRTIRVVLTGSGALSNAKKQALRRCILLADSQTGLPEKPVFAGQSRGRNIAFPIPSRISSRRCRSVRELVCFGKSVQHADRDICQ